MDSLSLKTNAKLAKSKFPTYEDIRLLSDYIIYGEDKIKNYVNLKQIAIDTFPENPNYSIKIMNDIIADISDNIFHYETLIEMYFQNHEYSKVISLYDELNDRKMTNISGLIIEFIAISYVNTNNIPFGCYLADQLNQANYKLSQPIALTCNIVQ